MLRIPLDQYTNYLKMELDGSVWGYRYNPENTANPQPQTVTEVRFRSENFRGKLIVYASLDMASKIPRVTRVPDRLNQEPVFLSENLEFVTRTGKSYKQFSLEQYILHNTDKIQ